MTTPVSFLHTSPGALGPVMQFYSENAPEYEITNQLDDGLLRMLGRGETAKAQERLLGMLEVARDVYGARLAMVTCSSVTTPMMEALEPAVGIPLLKIDTPMAEEAVRAGRRIGVVMTFAGTRTPTAKLLEGTAARLGTEIEMEPLFMPEAYEALLAGRPAAHDAILLPRIEDLAGQVDAIVLAQVSLARLVPSLEGRLKVPVFSSLSASLRRIREMLS